MSETITQTLTVRELRSLLETVGDQDAPIHMMKEFKYGQVVSTTPIGHLRYELDEAGNQHIIIN